MKEKFMLIHAQKAVFPLVLMVRLLKVSRAGYYAWVKRRNSPLCPRQARRDRLAELITDLHEASKQTSGYRRIRAGLARMGERVSEGLVRSIMSQLDLAGIQPRTSKRTTIPAADVAERPDCLQRDFTTDRPGIRFVGDITYLRTGEGWLYLATVIDLFNREVVGWAMADHMRTCLICDALTMAYTHGRIEPGAVFHSDRGSQYTSAEYAKLAVEYGITLSVGRTGVCWDNAVAESFFSMLKNEMYYRTTFPTRARARFAVMDYIEVFYNRQRLHSALGYRTPAQARHDHHNHNHPGLPLAA